MPSETEARLLEEEIIKAIDKFRHEYLLDDGTIVNILDKLADEYSQ